MLTLIREGHFILQRWMEIILVAYMAPAIHSRVIRILQIRWRRPISLRSLWIMQRWNFLAEAAARDFDAWIEQRRLDYPQLKAPPSAVSEFTVRYTYPSTEII